MISNCIIHVDPLKFEKWLEKVNKVEIKYPLEEINQGTTKNNRYIFVGLFFKNKLQGKVG